MKPRSEIEIVELTLENFHSFASDIARIHASAYSHGHFTSTFGAAKLKEYNVFLLKNSDISLAAVENGRVVGFAISGTAVSRGVAAFTQENRGFLIGKLLTHPQFLVAKVYGKIKARISPAPASPARYRLLSIATDPMSQSKGVGAKILAALEERLKSNAVKCYGLSVRANNPRAVDFYRRNGFIEEREFLGSLYFRKDLNQPF